MKRRTFLYSALTTTALPLALLETAGLAQSGLAQSGPAGQSGEPRIVQSGQDRLGEKHTRGFSSIAFKVTTQDSGGGIFVLEHSHLVPGGPPLHRHLEQDEWFYVMEGEVKFQIGGQFHRLTAGDSVLAPRRIPHTFTSVGKDPGRLLITFTPAGKMEAFFRDSEKIPPQEQDAAFFSAHGMELLGPPLAID
jgi:quercetin dioxygenase-like cupin family protein